MLPEQRGFRVYFFQHFSDVSPIDLETKCMFRWFLYGRSASVTIMGRGQNRRSRCSLRQ